MEGEIVTSQNTAVHTDHGVSINPGPCAWGVHGRNSYREFVSFPESIEDIPTRRNLRSMSGFGCVNAGHNAVFRNYADTPVGGLPVCPARSAVPRAGSVPERATAAGVGLGAQIR